MSDHPVWPIDNTIATRLDPDRGSEFPEGTWQFSRVKTLNVKEWRSKLKLYSPRMIEEQVMISRPDGNQTTCKSAYAIQGDKIRYAAGWVNGLSFEGLEGKMINPACYGTEKINTLDVAQDARMTHLVKIGAGLALRRFYLWSVLLGEGDGPRARFYRPNRVGDIPPAAIPPGRKRRGPCCTGSRTLAPVRG